MPAWKFLDTGLKPGAFNMALDEELLGKAGTGQCVPVLRLYGWDPPAVSIGRFQDPKVSVNRTACERRGYDIVRRVTGGRAVLHLRELTYSVIGRTDDPLFPGSIHGTYRVIAECLVTGLRSLGLPAEIVSRENRHASLVARRAKSPACFSSPSWYEIVVNGRKIVGSAQRRVSGAFLQHGSILVDYDPDLEAEVIPGGCPADAVTCVTRELGREIPIGEIRNAVVHAFSKVLDIRFSPFQAGTE